MTELSKTMEAVTRAQVAEFLPKAIQKSLQSYHEFMSCNILRQKPDEKKGEGENKSPTSPNIKEFAEFHKAAKVAISHVELLIKLAKWADLSDGKNDAEGYDQGQLAALLELAQRDVEQYNLDSGDDQEEDVEVDG